MKATASRRRGINNAYSFGPFVLNSGSRTLHKGETEIVLGSRAFDILAALVKARGEVMTQRQLMSAGWPGMIVESSNVRVQIGGLRRALSQGGDGVNYISSVHGRGYCLTVPAIPLRTSSATRPETTQVDTRTAFGLPASLTGALGRDECVREVSRLVLAHRIVSITGAGGSGKTTLAILVGHALRAFEDSIIFVDLGVIDQGEKVAETLAASLGYMSAGEALFPGLVHAMARRRMLIVLDNCEHVIDAVAPLCLRIVEGTQGVHILTTSREALRIRGEQVHRVPPLAFPQSVDALTVEESLQWPAIQLFLQRSREAGGPSLANVTEARTVADLCRRLDGNPHAIGLVAGRAGVCGIQSVAELLTRQSALNWLGRRDDSPRHQSIESMIEWSHNLLPAVAREVLYRLAVFSGGFTVDAVLEILPDDTLTAREAGDALVDLVDKSLVASSIVSGESRFRLLDTTRAYAAARLNTSGCRKKIEYRHALWYGRQSRRFVASGSPALPVTPADLDNMRAASEWMFTNGEDRSHATLECIEFAAALLKLGLLRECAQCCNRLLAALPPGGQAAKLRLLEMVAVTAYAGGDYDGDILQFIRRGLELAEELADLPTRFHLLAGYHLALTTRGMFAQSVEIWKQYQTEAASAGGHAEAVIACWLGGVSCHYMGKQAEAEACLRDGARLSARHQLRSLRYFEDKHLALSHIGQARVELARGRMTGAVDLARLSLQECRQNPDSLYQSISLCFGIFLCNDLVDEADGLLTELENVSAEYNIAVRQPVIDHLRGRLTLQRKSYPAAISLLQRCLDSLPASRISVVRNDALHALAEALLHAGQLEAAARTIDESIALATESLGAFNLADMLRLKAEIASLLPDAVGHAVDEAYDAALACAQLQGNRFHESRISLAIQARAHSREFT